MNAAPEPFHCFARTVVPVAGQSLGRMAPRIAVIAVIAIGSPLIIVSRAGR